MNAKQLFGKIVLDKNANEVGKIEDFDINLDDYTIQSLSVTLKKNFTSTENIIVDCVDIKAIGKYVFLNNEVIKEE